MGIIIIEKPVFSLLLMVICKFHAVIKLFLYFYEKYLTLSGSTMSVWTTSLVNTQEVINMLLDKYRVECPASNFSLFVVKDNGGMNKNLYIFK